MYILSTTMPTESPQTAIRAKTIFSDGNKIWQLELEGPLNSKTVETFDGIEQRLKELMGEQRTRVLVLSTALRGTESEGSSITLAVRLNGNSLATGSNDALKWVNEKEGDEGAIELMRFLVRRNGRASQLIQDIFGDNVTAAFRSDKEGALDQVRPPVNGEAINQLAAKLIKNVRIAVLLEVVTKTNAQKIMQEVTTALTGLGVLNMEEAKSEELQGRSAYQQQQAAGRARKSGRLATATGENNKEATGTFTLPEESALIPDGERQLQQVAPQG